MKLSKLILSTVIVLITVSCSARKYNNTAPYGRFAEGKIADIQPEGWLKEFLQRQVDGMTGHPEALSYPYYSCLWAGDLKRNTTTYGLNWWRYEQTAYYTDGLLRTGHLLNNQELINKGRQGIYYTIENASDNGEMGLKGKEGRWPMCVFFRAMQAEYEVSKDRRIVDALEKYYMNIINSGERIGHLAEGEKKVGHMRAILSIEGMLWTYTQTGNTKLLDYAISEWRDADAPRLTMDEILERKHSRIHGVTYVEKMKLPMLIYAYTGEEIYLKAALMANERLTTYHMLTDGVPSSNEHLAGTHPTTSHESCDITDYTWSLGHFLMTTGDGRWADDIEMAVFNAGPGAVTKDFKSLQYFSSPNQFIATGNSDHNPFRKGLTWMAYRPIHTTECCSGNIHRFMPNYISRMWLKGSAKNEIVAALFGPSTVKHTLENGTQITIKEQTNYPFEGTIEFIFQTTEQAKFPFTFRIPGWCKEYQVLLNGQKVDFKTTNGFGTINRKFANNDRITLEMKMDIEVKNWTDFTLEGRQHAGSYIKRGALLFSYAIPADYQEDKTDYPTMHAKKVENPDFKCWNITPTAKWNYSLATDKIDSMKLISTDRQGYPFDLNTTPYHISVPVREVKDWNLIENRYTPDIPYKFSTEKKVSTIELVPYGCTTLRLTVFPTKW